MTSAEGYGILGEFATPEALRNAAWGMRERGYKRMDAYSPIPVEGLREALGFRRTRLAWVVFGAGVVGAAGGLLLQYYISAVAYPLNIGGRPLASWPAFMIITFELCVLVAGLTAGIGMLAANHLPRPHHPLFNVQAFAERASTDRYFLCVEAEDPYFDPENVGGGLRALAALEVYEVPA